jgi:integrase
MSRPAGNRRSFLLEASLAKTTVARYRKAAGAFLDWCADNDERPSHFAEVDEFLCEWFHDLYQTRGSLSTAACGLNGLIFLDPRLKHRLPLARRALKGWQRLHPPAVHPPISFDVAVLIAVTLAKNGFVEEAVGTLLAFDGLLRVGELANLHLSDVADAKDVRFGSEYRGLSLRLRITKTGPNKFVMLRDEKVKSLLRWFIRRRGSKRDKLFSFSAASFRKVFKRAVRLLGLDPSIVPHSLRHGGATRLSLLGVALEDILRIGRWASTKSARHYVQSGPAVAASMNIPLRTAQLAARLAADPLAAIKLATADARSEGR